MIADMGDDITRKGDLTDLDAQKHQQVAYESKIPKA
jgi:hypothetical protein